MNSLDNIITAEEVILRTIARAEKMMNQNQHLKAGLLLLQADQWYKNLGYRLEVEIRINQISRRYFQESL